MFYNLPIAIRTLNRNGVYSMVNVVGLTMSLLACILISLWVQDELSYDRFHEDGDRIYKVLGRGKGNVDYWATTPAPLAAFIKPDMPEITEYCRTGDYYFRYLDYDNTKFRNLSGLAVDTSFFSVFSFPLVKGRPDNLFPDDLAIILSETLAQKIFGDEDPIGKMLADANDFTFHVTGIMKDFPENSSLQADFLVRFDFQQRTYPGNGHWTEIEEDWGNYFYSTYLKLNPHSDLAAATEKMTQKLNKRDDDMDYEFRLQPLHEMHLYALNGEAVGMKNVYLFSVIAVLILGIACINYVNLVTARASKRGKETAVRKIMGAKKPALLQQFLNETAILVLFSLMITTVFIYALVPHFNELAGKNLHFTFDMSVGLTYLVVALIALALAGLYPAFMLASFNPLEAFGVERKRNVALFRKILVVLQFTVSIALIIITIAITLQLRYMQNLNPGYNKENVLMVHAGNIGSHYRTVKERLSAEPSILSVSGCHLFWKMKAQGSRADIWKNEETGQRPIFYSAYVDNGFFDMMDIPIVEGRDFTFHPDTPPDEFGLQGIMVNETAAQLMGNGQSVVGMRLQYKDSIEIIGVMKDFNFLDFKQNIQPLVIWYSPIYVQSLYIKTAPGSVKDAVAAVEKVWKEYNPEYDFWYSFVDDDFDSVYKSDIRVNRIFSIFAIIAIFISCLGLFGLVTYTAETKTKEIGIRKVYGAGIRDIVEMLSKEFVILVGIAMLIAFPLAYFWISRMLQEYAYRIGISWWMFALATGITVVLMLLTVGVQALRAALADPIKSIMSGE
ncbi:MAG: ABC transporter permease [Bacteroidales bacterium]|nr:ABC transporter permease [Bacteroidales bacterium]